MGFITKAFQPAAAPQVPPPPPPPPVPEAPAVQDVAGDVRKEEAQRKKRSNTILTGALGLEEEPLLLGKPTLLGR